MHNEKVKGFLNQRLALKLEPIDKALAKATTSAEERDKLALDRERLCEQFVPRTWLDSAAKRAKQIKLVTHAPKFTHSDSKSAGALAVDQTGGKSPLLTTASLPGPELDVVGNAAALDVASLLKLADDDGRLLADQLRMGDTSALAEFAESSEELEQWLAGFAQAFEESQPQSHSLAKQLYFPVEEKYHLLSPLYASSLSHALSQKLRHNLYGEQSKQAREARKRAEPCEFSVVSYPKLAIVEYGGSKPQNISKLNSERGGRGYLLNCQPPSWQSHAKPPQTSKQFWQQLQRATWMTLKSLREYLEKHQNSEAVRRIKDPRKEMVDDIVDSFFQLSANIRLLSERADTAIDWSKGTGLTQAETLLLNPQRADVDTNFKQLREQKDWPEAIGKQFGLWLNQNLKTDKLNFGDTERDYWAGMIKHTIASLRDDLRFLQGGL